MRIIAFVTDAATVEVVSLTVANRDGPFDLFVATAIRRALILGYSGIQCPVCRTLLPMAAERSMSAAGRIRTPKVRSVDMCI